MKMKQSRSGKLHLITKEGFYACNRAVGKHEVGVIRLNKKYINCKNCLRKI